jgi:hypothetical protein
MTIEGILSDGIKTACGGIKAQKWQRQNGGVGASKRDLFTA